MAKIMMVSTVHQSKDIRIMQKEAVSLAQAGHDVSFVVTNDKEEVYKGVKIIPLKTEKIAQSEDVFAPLNVIKEVRKHHPDVVHAHDPELLPALMWLRLFGYKVVYDAHEDFPAQTRQKYFIPEKRREMAARWAERYLGFCVKRMNRVIAATPVIKGRLDPYNKHVTVINNFPLLTEFKEPREWSKRRKAAAFVGGGYENRGIRELMQALAICKIPLEFGGVVEPDDFKEEIHNSEGWKYVTDHGYISREEVEELMNDCCMGVIPYHPGPNIICSQPIKFFECMASSIPMVVSDFPYWRKMLEGCDCAFFVDPMNPQEIAEKMTWIAEHDEEARIMGERGRKAVLETYNWEHEAETLISVYDELLKK